MLIENDKQLSGEEFEQIKNKQLKSKGCNFIHEMILILNDPSIVMNYGDKTIISQGANRTIYRGESQIFSKSTANIYRVDDSLIKYDRSKQILLDKIRLKEFETIIKDFNIIKEWEYSVLYDAIAQHYGMKTDLIDVTSSFKVALFFACCKFDEKNKKYRPLTDKDLNNKSDNENYGVIYKKVNRSGAENYNNTSNEIWPLGYQPLMRCHRQYGHVIRLEDGTGLEDKSTGFFKYKFKHSVGLSEKIFKLMDEGEQLFPTESINYLDNIINEIQESKGFRKANVDLVIDNSNIDSDIKCKIKKEIYKEYGIDKDYIELTKKELGCMNNELKNFDFYKELGKKPTELKTLKSDDSFYMQSYMSKE